MKACDARLKKLRRDLKTASSEQRAVIWAHIDGVLDTRHILQGGKP